MTVTAITVDSRQLSWIKMLFVCSVMETTCANPTSTATSTETTTAFIVPSDFVMYPRFSVLWMGDFDSLSEADRGELISELTTRVTEEAAALGKGMVDAIKNRQTFPEQEDERNQAFEIMKFMVMTLREEWPFAWDYWNTHWDLTEENP